MALLEPLVVLAVLDEAAPRGFDESVALYELGSLVRFSVLSTEDSPGGHTPE